MTGDQSTAPRQSRVVATAGHVDHGKSTLVLALTGTDPDRFPEEKARGLTIDLGFAFATLPSGIRLGFVDVPGHVRFVKNMLAGVGAVDVALLVVAANEGWMPQTAEHAAILDLLDVRDGVIALTKTGLVDAETVELAQLELEERLAGTAAASWPVVPVDSLTRAGLDRLLATLDDTLASVPPPRDLGRPRLWVDRVFAAKGAGTIVTGTLTGGPLALDDDIAVEPGGRRARVRGIETHHERVDIARPGTRVALNLAGIDHAAVQRGHAVVRPSQWATVTTFDVALRPLPGQSFTKRSRVHVHVGSGDHTGVLRLLDEGGLARLRLDAALPLAPGDRVVLRSSGAQTTVGGAEVLDLSPARRPADAIARLRLPLGARVMAAHPWLAVDDAVPLVGSDDIDGLLVAPGHARRAGAWLVAPAECDRVRALARDRVQRDDGPGVDVATLAAACGIDPTRLRLALAGDAHLVIERDLVRDATRAGIDDDPVARTLVAALDAQPFNPPAPADVGASPTLVRALVRSGTLVDLDGVVITASALDEARRRVVAAMRTNGSVTVSDVRDLLGSTRKYVLPILGRLDADGVTRRRGDERVPGPRAGLG